MKVCIIAMKGISICVERLANVTEELVKMGILEPFQFATCGS